MTRVRSSSKPGSSLFHNRNSRSLVSGYPRPAENPAPFTYTHSRCFVFRLSMSLHRPLYVATRTAPIASLHSSATSPYSNGGVTFRGGTGQVAPLFKSSGEHIAAVGRTLHGLDDFTASGGFSNQPKSSLLAPARATTA